MRGSNRRSQVRVRHYPESTPAASPVVEWPASQLEQASGCNHTTHKPVPLRRDIAFSYQPPKSRRREHYVRWSSEKYALNTRGWWLNAMKATTTTTTMTDRPFFNPNTNWIYCITDAGEILPLLPSNEMRTLLWVASKCDDQWRKEKKVSGPYIYRAVK